MHAKAHVLGLQILGRVMSHVVDPVTQESQCEEGRFWGTSVTSLVRVNDPLNLRLEIRLECNENAVCGSRNP